MKGKKKLLWLVPILVLALVAGVALYLGDYYHAEDTALAALDKPPLGVDIYITEDYYAFVPDDPIGGFLFYPGGKVQYESYAPLLRACAEKGVLCVAVRMPGNLAVLSPNAANGIPERFPKVENWYIGGHSLGGAMAASYAVGHKEALSGVVLLAAYATGDIRELPVLCIYGTEDQVMNQESYEKNRKNLPEDFREVLLSGGCHAYFGSYGPQKGDGTPTLSPEEQQERTAAEIAAFIGKT